MSLDLRSNKPQNKFGLVKPNNCTVYEFENFRLESEHLMLYRDGEEISLTPKQVETLLALIEVNGEIVGKEALMSRLWGDTAVEESNLVQNIHRLRKVLGQTEDGKLMIETLRRRGYRFNGRLKQKDRDEPEAVKPRLVPVSEPVVDIGDDARIEKPFPGFGGRKRWVWAFIIFAVAVSSAYLVYRSGPTSRSAQRQFAVLPLKPIDPARRDDLYENGIADALINQLSSGQGFIVRPLNAVRKYKDIEQDPIAAGREQNVDYVLASNYQMADGRIKVTSQLLNVATGRIASSYQTEKDTGNIFAAQDAIAAEFGARILSEFGSSATRPPASRGTSNEEAYRLYQQAMYLSAQRKADSLPKAVEAFDRAVDLDPNYAQAWAGKALAHWRIGMSKSNGHTSEARSESIEAINRSLALDPDLPEAYSALCHIKFSFDYDFEGAESACKRALELGPESSLAHQAYGMFLTTRGRFEEAIAENKRAIALDPTSYENHRFYANALYFARRYDEALAQYKRLLEMDPNAFATYNWLIRTLEAQGKESEAFEWFIKSLNIQKAGDATIQRYWSIYQQSGYRGVLLERIRTSDEGRANHFRMAGWYASVGDNDKAFAFLEKAYEMHNGLINLLQVEPQFDVLRDDPRYADLVRRIEGR
jgi:DNA-binding winged helix-turn-helix (wHTH) protein/tetratricopeptide (TPR) repeat protein